MRNNGENKAHKGFILRPAQAIDELRKKQFKIENKRSALLLEKDILLTSVPADHGALRMLNLSLSDIEKELATVSSELTILRSRLSKQVIFAFAGAMFVLFVISYVLIKIFQPDFGHDIRAGYYEALINILAALLIALFLTPNKENLPKSQYPLSPWTLALYGGKLEGLFGLTVGIVACLIAIGKNYQGTALFLATIFSILIIIPITFERIIHGKID